MKLTNAEIFNAKEPLRQLGNCKLPVVASLALVKLGTKIMEHLKPIEQVRDGLIKTHGSVNPEIPGAIAINPGDENWEKFVVEYDELMAQEVEIVITKVALPATLEIEPAVLMALEKFITIAE